MYVWCPYNDFSFSSFNLTLWLIQISSSNKEGTKQTQDKEGCSNLE